MAYDADIERLNYYEGQFLGAVDFQAEQQYQRDMRRRHSLGQHTWGIVSGLELAQALNGNMAGSQAEVDVYLQPGMAVDGFGREIVVLGQAALTPSMFAAFYDQNPGANPIFIAVWIAYRESLAQASSDACASMNVNGAFARIQETYTLTVTAGNTPPVNDSIVVDGSQTTPPTAASLLAAGSGALPDPPPLTLPFDDSVSFQEFSTDDSSLDWWLPLGQVLWDPYNQVFVQINADPVLAAASAARGREYAGNVSSAVYVPGGKYWILERDAPYPLPAAVTDPNYGGVQTEIAGSLQVDRLLNAQTSVLIGRPYNASDPALSPLTIAASGTNEELIQFRNPSGQQTWHVCENVNGNQPGINFGEFTSGGSPADGRLFLQTGGNVGIGTLSPQQNLSVNAGINLDQASLNKGGLAPGLSFGSASGEGIASNRVVGGVNAYGLDFYAGSAIRMSLTQDGKLGIGTTAPGAPLEISGGNYDLNNTPGDLRIGNSAYSLKFGVALTGAIAGTARIRAAGGVSQLMIGTDDEDTMIIAGGGVSLGGNLTVGSAPLVMQPAPSPGALNVNGNRTYLLGTDKANFHWIMAGGFADGTTTGNNALGFTFDSVHGQGYINIPPNWTVAFGSPKIGFVADRFVNRDAAGLERGDVVVIHQDAAGARYCGTSRIPLIEVERTTQAQNARVCGVVDEPAAHSAVLSDLNQSEIAGLRIGLMVTLGAYAHCKVDADIAPIVAGDLLTTSTTAGYAQKLPPEVQVRSGMVIGKALGSLNKGKGLIPVLISHQ